MKNTQLLTLNKFNNNFIIQTSLFYQESQNSAVDYKMHRVANMKSEEIGEILVTNQGGMSNYM